MTETGSYGRMAQGEDRKMDIQVMHAPVYPSKEISIPVSQRSIR